MDNDSGARILLFVVLLAAGIGVSWVAQAAATGRLKRNSLAGIRLPTTMASDEAWRAAHVRARPPMLCAGVVSVAAAVLALLPLPTPVVNIGIVVAAAITLALVVYGGIVGGIAAKSVSHHDHS